MNIMKDADSGERALFRMASEKRIPINGSIEVSPLCNMDCDMCYVRLSRSEMEAKGRLRTADEWLSLANQMKDAGVLFFAINRWRALTISRFQKTLRRSEETGHDHYY